MRGKGDMHGKGGACVVKGGGHVWQKEGACVWYALPPPHEIQPVIVRAVRILLECILVCYCFSMCSFEAKFNPFLLFSAEEDDNDLLPLSVCLLVSMKVSRTDNLLHFLIITSFLFDFSLPADTRLSDPSRPFT